MALPGASEQLWHVDGEHLFWEQPDLPHLPPHCVNIIVPLVDMSPENGGTHFCLGSHTMTSGTDDIVWQKDEWKAEIGFEEEPYALVAKAGDILAFDYRVLHRAVANDTDYARPVLYYTYVRRWFRDGLNFPKRSLFDTTEGVTKANAVIKNDGTNLAETVRPIFPALIDTRHGKRIFADGAAGTQVPGPVADAVRDHLLHRNANVGGEYHTSEAALDLVTRSRAAAADLLGCETRGITFGANCTNIMFHLARSVVNILKPGDNIVLSEACHDANIAPWLYAARDAGASVRWLRINKHDASLHVNCADDLIDDNTKLVAIGIASNATGNVHTAAVREIIKKAKAAGAHTVIDGTQFVAHHRTDFDDLGADAFVCRC